VKEKRCKEERSREEGGEGQYVEEEYKEPVMWRQVLQWHIWPDRGRDERWTVVV
jgi:hypothetical protein